MRYHIQLYGLFSAGASHLPLQFIRAICPLVCRTIVLGVECLPKGMAGKKKLICMVVTAREECAHGVVGVVASQGRVLVDTHEAGYVEEARGAREERGAPLGGSDGCIGAQEQYEPVQLRGKQCCRGPTKAPETKQRAVRSPESRREGGC